jgi:glycosyltransferase involved in cell wall biosynthesis
VEIIHQQNQGHTKARERGLKASHGEYVCFVDADDWVDDNYIPTLNEKTAAAVRRPDIIAFNYHEDTDSGTKFVYSSLREGEYDKEELARSIYPMMLSNPNEVFYTFGVFPSLWSKAFRREIIADILGLLDPGIRVGEDAFCVYLALYKADSLLVINDCLYHYFINNDSITHKYKRDYFPGLTCLCELMDRYYPESLLPQVRQYKLSMLIGAITNETRGSIPVRSILKEIEDALQKSTFYDCVHNSVIRKMPTGKRIVWFLLKRNLFLSVVLSLRLLKL